jgi:uncharacterized membrane protein
MELETQSRPATLPAQLATPPTRGSRLANDLVIGLARHWLAVLNVAWAVYFLLPFLAPILMQLGLEGPAQAIYFVYSVFCHQLPDHSYFLFGPTPIPQDAELIAGGMAASTNLWVQRAYIGSPEMGWKVAICQRDVAIWGSVVVGGLVYALLRRRGVRLPFKVYVFFIIPIAVDGLSQMVGLRESNWLLRTVTGALFGFATVLFTYPFVDEAMQEVLDAELGCQESTEGWEPAPGQPTPGQPATDS